ncbi:MAG TPA: ribosome silencing factor [Candidatus Omnitrophota bacterium]|nr:ribosome silencing factor [Candidatus Omnitrophota bacterium]HQB12742.1 ribosome silencing factor [Candidatus Omnitrophota bacterium]
MQPKRKAELIRSLAEDKKAEDLVLLDISKLSSLTHYFIVTHGNSAPHVRAISEHIMVEMKKRKMPVFHVEGLQDAKWVLLDFGSVIVHVFYKETREFYSIERLWGEGKLLLKRDEVDEKQDAE